MKVVSGIFKFFAVVLAIVVVLTLPAALLGQSAGRLLFSPSRIFELLNENVFNIEVMASLAELSLSEGNPEQEAESPFVRLAIAGMKELTHEEWVEAIDLIAPPELISDTMLQIVRGYYVWIEGPEPVPDFRVDMKEWKDTLGKNFTPVADMVMSKLPACSSMELLQFAGVVFDVETEIPLCKPPEPFYSDYLNAAYLSLPSELSQMDDEVNLAARSEMTEAEWAETKDGILILRASSQVAWVGVLILYVMAISLGARSFSGVLKWAAWPVLFAGGFLLLIALMFFAPTRLAGGVTGMADQGVPPVMVEPMQELMRGIFRYLARPMLLQSLAMIFLGVVGLGVAVFVDSRQQPEMEGSTVLRQETLANDQPTIIEPQEMKIEEKKDDGDEKDDSKPSGMFG